MALSTACIQKHIAHWEQRLAATFYSHRRHWPARLFRHEPLENVVPLLKSAMLLSRSDASSLIVNDIAPTEIINATTVAHNSVRLYFRPKTPTQYHIEGIREPAEYFMGKHAPILYMMVFDAEKVLTTGGVRFSASNMQGNPPVFDSDPDFSKLDFEKIYHEGPMSQEQIPEIIRARCAEVLCPSPLMLAPYLQSVICRSAAERQLLLHELGPSFAGKDRVRVFNEAGMFNADYVFVETVDLANDGIHVQFHPARRGAASGAVELRLYKAKGGVLYRRWTQPALEFWKKWHFTSEIPDGKYLVEIIIRGCLAYRSVAILESKPF